MRIPSVCPNCMIDLATGALLPEQFPASSLQLQEVQESGLYRFTCPRGHQSIRCLQQMRFEILFEIAAHAIIDGYYREAIISFASALERYFEFYVRVRCDQMGVSPGDLAATWKPISKQSERQLGAYAFVHLIASKSPPGLLSHRNAEFRNDVVHRGRIPERTKAIGFGDGGGGNYQRGAGYPP